MSLKVIALAWMGIVAGFSQTPFPPLTITRQNNGDMITLLNPNHECNDNFCIGLTSGTGVLEKSSSKGCTCQCHKYLPAFREDLNICVDDIQETVLAPFVGGSTSKLIPFVFLPMKGQLIYPSKEISLADDEYPPPKYSCDYKTRSYLEKNFNICTQDESSSVSPGTNGVTVQGNVEKSSNSFPVALGYPGGKFEPSEGLQTPVCAVSKAKFLTTTGWMDLKNPINGDVPFRLYRDEGRSFLQWDGEPDLRIRLSGRLILVYLKCREGADVNYPASKITTPTVAFRIVGTPSNSPHPYNVSEVTFISNAQSSSAESNLLSLSEYVAIGICSVLLGLIYVASVFLYLHIRKRNRMKSGSKSNDLNQDPHSMAEEGIVKNNPLLGLSGHFQPDSEETMSDNEGQSDVMFREERLTHRQLTSAVVHPQQSTSKFKSHYLQYHLQESASIERLPEENVSIVETLEGREEKPDEIRGLNGTVRRKLYFNPAYFEPHLLAAPPPAAIEFLQKIREVICIAKQKMSTKKYIPTLLGIPEEDYGMNVHSFEFNPLSRNGSIISLKRENSRRKRCSGCPGCQSDDCRPTIRELSVLPTCSNCVVLTHDAKQRNIRKWLEDIPVIKNSEDPNIFSDKVSIPSSKKSPKRIRSPVEGPPSLPSTRSLIRSVSKREPKKISVRGGNSPTRSLSPDFGRSNIRPMTPRSPSEKASESDCSGSEIYHKTTKMKRRQGSRIKKPKTPPPLPPGGNKINTESTENIYDTVANDNIGLTSTSDVTINGEGVQITRTIKKNMKAVINEFANANGINKRIGSSSFDYEADSLERTPKQKPALTEYAELSSSQPSPSLSSALPMDEEMTMRNAVFNTKTGNRTISKLPKGHSNSASDTENEYELIVLKKSNSHLYKLPELLQRNKGYSLVSEVYVNNGYNYNSSPSSPSDSNSSTMEKPQLKVCYSLENQPGKLLIEVEDCLDNYIPVNDSDSFEPDTLDRKPSKRITKPTENFVDSLERPQQILLRTTGSFRKENTINQTLNNFNRNFGSLREIYEAKTRGKAIEDFFAVMSSSEEEDKLLTLEERHNRRQRQTVPPDVIPPPPRDTTPIYDQPKHPIRKILTPDNLANKPPLPPKNGKNRSAKTTSYEKKPISFGIPDKIGDSPFCMLKNYEINNNRGPGSNFRGEKDKHQFILFPTQNHQNIESLKNLQSIIDKELKKNWVENELNNKNRNMEKIVNTEEMLVNSKKSTNIKRAWQKFVDITVPGKPEDSGYLSTDSNESRAGSSPSRLGSHNDRGSETDESLGDVQSESGGESVETHSVFFGRYRKSEYLTISTDSGNDTDRKLRNTNFAIAEDLVVQSSDSEHASYATVVPLESTTSSRTEK